MHRGGPSDRRPAGWPRQAAQLWKGGGILRDAAEIRALEEKLLSAEFRRDRGAVAALLAEDFREFGSSGRVWNKQKILDQLETEKRFEAEIADFQAVELAADAVLVTYKVAVRRPGSEGASSLRSSIWVKREGRWRILFHQGTASNRSWREYLKSGAVASEEFMEEVEDLPPQERERRIIGIAPDEELTSL